MTMTAAGLLGSHGLPRFARPGHMHGETDTMPLQIEILYNEHLEHRLAEDQRP